MIDYISQTSRPNREEEERDKEYHVENAKWAIGAGLTEERQDFVNRAIRNKRYYHGLQWDDEEDIETFLKDETGEERNRLKIVKNIIRPIVERFRGNISNMSMNARVRSVSPHAVDRREEDLMEKYLLTDLVQDMSPQFQEHARKTHRIGDTKNETKRIFDNTWVDKYEEAMEHLIGFSKSMNDFDGMKFRVGEEVILTGMAVGFSYTHGEHRRYVDWEPERYIWDPNAKRADFKDASFWGLWDKPDPSTLYEQFNLDDMQRQAIEDYISNAQGPRTTGYDNIEDTHVGDDEARPTVYYMYWRDYETFRYAYVENEHGYPEMVRLNEDEDSEGNVYTEEDVIDRPDTNEAEKIFGDDNIAKRVTDVIRYCTVIMKEELMSVVSERSEEAQNMEAVGDMVLDHGLYEYPEPNIYDQTEVLPPIKAMAWSYVNGRVMSPIDDIIDPQRMINRIVSVAESQINNSGGSSIVYDKDGVDPDGGEEELIRDVDAGRPVGLSTKGRGVPNSMSVYDNTPKQGTYQLFQLVNVFQSFAQEITGVSAPMQGQNDKESSDQLVGVTQMLIEQGSLIQEPLFETVSNFMLQMFQDIVTVGKDHYIDQGGKLSMIAGDKGAQILTLTDDMRMENFAAFLEREASDEVMKKSGNQLLQFLLQSQMVDQKFFASHYNRSSVDQIMRGLRENVGEQQVQAEQQEQDQQEQAQQQMQAMQQQAEYEELEKVKQEAQQAQENEKQRQHELDKEMMKGLSEVIAKEEMQQE